MADEISNMSIHPSQQVWNIAELRLQIAKFYKLRWCKNRPDKFVRTFGITELREYSEHTGTYYTWKTLLACDQVDLIFTWVKNCIFSVYNPIEANAHLFEYQLVKKEQQVIDDSDDSNDFPTDRSEDVNKISELEKDELFYYAIIHRLKRLLKAINYTADDSYEIRTRLEKAENMNKHVRAKSDINTYIYYRKFSDVYCCPIDGSTMRWMIENDMTKHLKRKYKLHSYECDYTPLSLHMTQILAQNDFFQEDYQSQIRNAITRLYPSLFCWLVDNGQIGDTRRVWDLRGYGYTNVKTLLKRKSFVSIYHRSTLDEISWNRAKKLLNLGLQLDYQLHNYIREKEPFVANSNWELIEIILSKRPYSNYEIVNHLNEHLKHGQTSCRVCLTLSNEQHYDMCEHIIQCEYSSTLLQMLNFKPNLRMWWFSVEKQNIDVMWYCWSQSCFGLPGNHDILQMMTYAYENTGYRFIKPSHNPKNITNDNLKHLCDRYPESFSTLNVIRYY